MIHWAEEAFDSIDAGLFSGDSFHDEASLREIEEYLDRWARVIDVIREDLPEGEANAV